MDLRKRLIGSLGALLGALMLVAVLINLSSLRHDINAEVSASAQLVQVLLKAGQIEHDLPAEEAGTRLQAMLQAAPLRHLTITLEQNEAQKKHPATSTSTWLSRLLSIESTDTSGQLIRLGEQNLRIAPNPNSEIDERLGDTVRLCITLLLFSGATLLITWQPH